MTCPILQTCMSMSNGEGKREHNMRIKKGGEVVMEGEKLELTVTYGI